jgi:hypothetical protein
MASAMSIASLYRGLVSSHVFCGACACRYSVYPVCALHLTAVWPPAAGSWLLVLCAVDDVIDARWCSVAVLLLVACALPLVWSLVWCLRSSAVWSRFRNNHSYEDMYYSCIMRKKWAIVGRYCSKSLRSEVTRQSSRQTIETRNITIRYSASINDLRLRSRTFEK